MPLAPVSSVLRELDNISRPFAVGVLGVLYFLFLYMYGYRYIDARSLDLPSFYTAAQAVFNHATSPYDVDFLKSLYTRYRVFPYLYPPPSLLLFYPFSLFSYETVRIGMLVFNHLCLLYLIYLLLYRLLGWSLQSRRGLFLLGCSFILFFKPVAVTIGHGQVNLILACLLCLFWLAARENRPLTSALFLCGAIMLKTYPVLILPLLLLSGHSRIVVSTLMLLVLVTMLSIFLLPLQIWQDWYLQVVSVAGYGSAPRGLFEPAVVTNQSLNGLFSRLFTQTQWSYPVLVSPTVGILFTYAGALLLLAGSLFAVMLANREGRHGNIDQVMVIALPMIYLIAPFSWAHHLVYLLPAMLVFLASGGKGNSAPAWPLLAIAGLAVVLLAMPSLLQVKGLLVLSIWAVGTFHVFSQARQSESVGLAKSGVGVECDDDRLIDSSGYPAMVPGARKSLVIPVLSIAGMIFLAFILGVSAGVFNLYPASAVKDAKAALLALQYATGIDMGYSRARWIAVSETLRSGKGLTIHDPERAYQGYTLYASGDDGKAMLLDMGGAIVHQWKLPLSKVWDPGKAINKELPDKRVYWRDMHAFPNGDLLAIYTAEHQTPWGMALVKMNRDSEPIWVYQKNAHHDLSIDDSGRIYVLTQETIHSPPRGLEHLEMPVLDERIAILDRNGNELKEISILKAIRDSAYATLLNGNKLFKKGDLLHTNTVEVIGPKAAKRLPFAKVGQVLVCLRNLNVIVIIDPVREIVTWAMRGPWIKPHDPEFLDNGNLLIFDNKGNLGGAGVSRILEMNPVSGEILWSYSGIPSKPLSSKWRSRQQRLPNGNTFVTASHMAALFEVTHDGSIVWEYINPVRSSQGREDLVPVVMGATRYGPEELPFLTGLSERASVVTEIQ